MLCFTPTLKTCVANSVEAYDLEDLGEKCWQLSVEFEPQCCC